MSKEISLETLAATSKPTPKPIVELPKEDNKPVENMTNEMPTNVETVVQGKPIKQHRENGQPNNGVKMGGDNLEKGKKFNPSQVASTLIKAGVMEEKHEEVEDAPVVKEAFESMIATIERRKEGANQLLETMKANAEEDALDAELENGLKPEDSEVVNNIRQYRTGIDPISQQKRTQEEEDFAELDDMDDEPNVNIQQSQPVAKEQPKSMNQYNISSDNTNTSNTDNAKPNPEVAETMKKEPVVEEEPKETVVSKSQAQIDKENEEFDKMFKNLEDDENDEPVADETQQEMIDRFKKSMQSVQINQDQIDFTKFTIKQKPISSSFVLNNLQNNSHLRKADWVLFHTKKAQTFSECSGLELDTLRHTMENANDVNRVISSLRFIYDHTIDANKPSFESWCKLIRTEDIDSMYYGIYKACYSDSNLIARTCTADACKKTSLIPTDIDAMVKYGLEDDNHDEIKKEFDAIFNHDTTTESESFKSTLMQISNDLVVAYSPATLYSTFIVYATVRNDITSRYSEDLSTLSYIDNFFYIDRANNELVPIDIKEYPGNLNKTALSRLKAYREIRKALTNDQYNAFMGKLNNLIGQSKIYYVMPECKCPECGATMEETRIDSMLNLLFTRAQLARIRNL